MILVAEDDPDDQFLLVEALEENGWDCQYHFVTDGEEVMDFLYHRGSYSDIHRFPRPSLILLDLNMPRKDGREVLRDIKFDPGLRQIPIVVLTTSSNIDDITKAYDLGVNSFIAKPVSFESMVTTVRVLIGYWFHILRLPDQETLR